MIYYYVHCVEMLLEISAIAAYLQTAINDAGAAEYEKIQVDGKLKTYIAALPGEFDLKWNPAIGPGQIKTESIQIERYAFSGYGNYEFGIGVGHKSKRVLWCVA